MAENELDAGASAQDQNTSSNTSDSANAQLALAEGGAVDFDYNVQVEDLGPATKRVTVEIPADRIETKLKDQFKDIRKQAAIPGFRPGHAPQKLVEKRFHAEVSDQVRRELVSESYQQALQKHSLQVIGEPEFENADQMKLPESGALQYSFNVEVQPKFDLPELKGLHVRRPTIAVNEENVDQAMTNLRQQQGTLSPVEGRGVETGDYVTADVHVKINGEVITHQHDAPLVARSGRIAGIYIDDLDKQLAGLEAGQKRDIKAAAPDTHPNDAMRGKEVQIEVAVKDIKSLELPEVNTEFLNNLGFEKEDELRDALREQMQERIASDINHAMREQVNNYLLDRVQIELPAKMSDRQTDRVVRRRMLDMMMRGVDRDQVEAAAERLRTGAREEAARELRLFFILQEIANQQKVDVSEAELNGRITTLAIQHERRPEKMKQDMSRDGTLMDLYIQMREQKAVDAIIAQANVEDIAVESGTADSSGGRASESAQAPAEKDKSEEAKMTKAESGRAESGKAESGKADTQVT